MKPAQDLQDKARSLARPVLAMRNIIHAISRSVRNSLERRPPPLVGMKIEIIRDICTQPEAPQPQSFPLFMALPQEIRLLIWHHASTAGRVVELQWCVTEMGFRNRAAPRPPAVLHTCSESRAEALRVFQPYFSMQGLRKPIYIDPINDILFFRLPLGSPSWQWMQEWVYRPNRMAREALLRVELRGIRRVAFLERDINYGRMAFLALPVRLLPDLEELMVLVADWSLRSCAGRGRNCIEGVSDCVHHAHNNVQQTTKTVKEWEAQLGWEELKGDRPLLTVRHWCLREEE